MTPLLAAIDLGTNTARLLIGSVTEAGSIRQAQLVRRITRLGGGFSRLHGIAAEARQRSVTALSEFARIIRDSGVTRVRAVATSAVRDAVNGREFCAAILELTGINLEVIDGREEALLTLRGVMSGLDSRSGNFMVFDVGGGSTEYTVAADDDIVYSESIPLGVVRLTEGKVTPDAMAEKVGRELEQLKRHMSEAGCLTGLSAATLVGTAGTATTLAAISMGMTDYDYRLVNNYVLCQDDVRRIFERLQPLTPSERLEVPGLEKGREDLIIAGIIVTLQTMERFGFRELKVSDFGLLEGVLFGLADRAG